jgi:hypothetical protein
VTLGPVQGKHSPEVYVHLCARIHEEAGGGYVHVTNGRHWRRVWWVAGSPVWYESNLPGEQLGASLAAVGLLDEIRLLELQSETGDDATLRDVILRHSDVPGDVLHEHLRNQVARGVSSPLVWARGEIGFEPLVALPAGILRSAVLASEPPLQLLWHGVEAHVRMDQVLGWVSAPEAGGVLPTDALADVLPALIRGTPLAPLLDPLSKATTVEALFMAVPSRSESLITLLWLLELAGLVTRGGGDRRPPLANGGRQPAPSAAEQDESPFGSSVPAASVPGQRPPEASRPDAPDPLASRPGAPPPGSRPGARSRPGRGASVPGGRSTSPGGKGPATPIQIELAIRADHKRRMGRDYYGFLGVEKDASVAELEARANKLVNRWMRPMKSRRTPPKARELAEELLGTVRLVWRTLSDDGRRAEYDRRMSRGQAPKAGVGPRPADVSTITSGTHSTARKRPAEEFAAVGQMGHREAVNFIDKGQYDRAAGILRRIRQENPSDPDLLADLGWAEWRCANGDSDKKESAEDYVRLALTFHPDHPRALEYMARIALDQKDLDGARGRLRAVLRTTPDARWAQAALDALSSEGGSKRR